MRSDVNSSRVLGRTTAFSLLNGFDFQPGFIPLRSVRCVRPLGDNAFPIQLGCMFEHLLPVANEVLRIENPQLDGVFAEKVQQQFLALDLRQLAEVTITPEKVEGIVDQPVLSTGGEFGLQLREVGSAFMGDHH